MQLKSMPKIPWNLLRIPVCIYLLHLLRFGMHESTNKIILSRFHDNEYLRFITKFFIKNLSPNGREIDIEAIIRIIDNAEKFIHVAVMDYSPTFLYGNNKHQFWPNLDNHIRKGISIIDYDLFGRFFKKVVSECRL